MADPTGLALPVARSGIPFLRTEGRYGAWIFLAVLTVTHLSAILDRVAISLLVEPIKADLGLSDTQVSLLQGLALMLGLVAALIPMGILVDRVNRTKLLAAGAGAWSLMTGLCGLAGNFGALFMARAGVGASQACLLPASASLISDIFDKRRLGLALSIFMIGGAIGTGLSFVAGGIVIGAVSRHGDVHLPLIGMLHPWQLTLVLIAAPGVLMALILNALPHPPRGNAPKAATVPSRAGDALRDFYRDNKRLLLSHHIAIGASGFVLLGAYSWVAPLFSRVHAWEPASIGVMTGMAVTIATPIGLLGGGIIGDYLLRYGAYMRLLVCAISMGCAALCGLLYPLISDPWAVLPIYGGMTLFATLPHGVGNAALQHIVPNEIRGRISAIFYFVVTVVSALGPICIALVADTIFPFQTGIRYAIAIVVPSALLVAAALYLWAIPPYRRLEARQAEAVQD